MAQGVGAPILGVESIEAAGVDTANSRGTAVATNASANTKGNWVQIIASTAKKAVAILLIAYLPGASPQNGLVDIGTGGTGSEVALVSNIAIQSSDGFHNSAWAQLPIMVPAGTRLNVRWQCSTGSSTGYFLLVLMEQPQQSRTFPPESVSPAQAAFSSETCGATTSTSRGTTITASGSANTKGSYTQLLASTAKRSTKMLVILGRVSSSNNGYLVDIATGGAGAEVVQVPNLPFEWGDAKTLVGYLIDIVIPAGSRIAARCQSATGSATIDVEVILFEGEK